MGYDSSVTNRKGCNYCLRRKDIYAQGSDSYGVMFEDTKCMRIYDYQDEIVGDFEINYCPICGKKLS